VEEDTINWVGRKKKKREDYYRGTRSNGIIRIKQGSVQGRWEAREQTKGKTKRREERR
jgi:hypothetical protein